MPKFKQLVIAEGIPPETVMFLAASETAIEVPICGSACTYLELQSTHMAKALFVSLMLTIAASVGLLVDIFTVPTMLSYCS